LGTFTTKFQVALSSKSSVCVVAILQKARHRQSWMREQKDLSRSSFLLPRCLKGERDDGGNGQEMTLYDF